MKTLMLWLLPAFLMVTNVANAQSTSQDASAPKDRKEVKADTKNANKAGGLRAPDEEIGPSPAAGAKSTRSRKDVKDEAKAANKAGELREGEGGVDNEKPVGSSKTRAQVKEEAKAANKAQRDKPKSADSAQ